MSEPAGFNVRRIRVALEPGDGTQSIGSAVMIAARLNAAIEGLLLDEGALDNIGDALVARYVTRFPVGEETTRPDVAAELHGLFRLVETVIAADAARLGVSWSLHVVNRPNDPLLGTLEPSDLLIAPARSRFLERLVPPGSNMTAFAGSICCSLMILTSPTPMQRPVVFAVSDFEMTCRSLAAAIRLGGSRVREIELVISPGGQADLLVGATETWLREQGHHIRILPISTGSIARSFAIAAPVRNLIVVPATLPGLEAVDAAAFLGQIRSPVLIVR